MVEQVVLEDTRNAAWSRNSESFGRRMLSKMGWSDGKGLGKNEDGIVNHIGVARRVGQAGVGADSKSRDRWDTANKGFADVLARLNQKNGAAAGSPMARRSGSASDSSASSSSSSAAAAANDSSSSAGDGKRGSGKRANKRGKKSGSQEEDSDVASSGSSAEGKKKGKKGKRGKKGKDKKKEAKDGKKSKKGKKDKKGKRDKKGSKSSKKRRRGSSSSSSSSSAPMRSPVMVRRYQRRISNKRVAGYSDASKKEIFGTVVAVEAPPDPNFLRRYGAQASAPAGAPAHHGEPGIVTINSTKPITEYFAQGPNGAHGNANGNSNSNNHDHHHSHGRLDPDAARCESPGFGDPPVPAGAPKSALVGFGHDDTSDEEVRQKRIFGKPARL